MSKHRITRVPAHISQVLEVYQAVSAKNSFYPSKHIRQYLEKSSEEHLNFQQHKLVQANTFDKEDFPMILSHSIKPIFKSRLKLAKLEHLTASDLFKLPVEEDSLDSKSRKTVKRFSDYEAKLISRFQAHFNSYTYVPNSSAVERAFKWYLRLLDNTPIFLVLKQEDRLFSESSIHQLNHPLLQFKDAIDQLAADLVKQSPDLARTYHLGDLTATDIFSVAIKAQNEFTGKGIDPKTRELNWSRVNETQDKLVDAVKQSNRIEIIDKEDRNVSKAQMIQFFKGKPTRKIIRELETQELEQLFPFDMKFSNFYVLCIEEPILAINHHKLFDLLESSPFEIVGARLSLTNPLISHFFQRDITSATSNQNLTYNELLKLAEKSHVPSQTRIEPTVKRLGELGLTHVEKGCHNNCIYLLPK